MARTLPEPEAPSVFACFESFLTLAFHDFFFVTRPIDFEIRLKKKEIVNNKKQQ
jgi:hypothetical protein